MNGESETLPDKIPGEVAEKLENLEFVGRKIMDLSVGCDAVKSIASSSSSEAGWVNQGRTEYLINSRGATERWVIDEGQNRNEPSLPNIEKEQNWNNRSVDENGLRRLGQMSDRRFGSNDEIVGLREDRRRNIAQFDSLEYNGDNRTELLRKIDELTDQLSRSTMSVKHTENNPHHLTNVHYNGSDNWISSSSSEKYRPFMQYPYPDHPSAPTSYISQYAESSAYMNMHATGGDNFSWTDNIAHEPMQLNPRHLKNSQNNHYNPSEDRFSDRPTSKNRPFMHHPFPYQNPGPSSFMTHYAEPSAGIYMHPRDRRYVDMADRSIEKNPDHLRIVHDGHYKASEDSFSATSSMKNRPTLQYPHPVPASYINRYGEPSAYISMHEADSFHNFHPPQNIRSRVHAAGHPDQRFLDIPHNAASMPQFQSHNLQYHAGWPSKLDSEVTSLASHQRPRLQPITGTQHCSPIGRGAPFITCKNCFQSLQVPERAMVKGSMQKKMRCGSCASMIVVDISNKNFLVCIYEPKVKRTSVVGNDNIKLIEGNSQAQGHTNRASLTFSSQDYDHSGYDFQSMDREPIPQMKNQQVLAESVGTKSLHCTSSYTADEVATHDHLAASRRNSSPTELSVKVKPPPPPMGSSLQEYFEYSNKYHRGNHFKKGNIISDQKTLMPNLTASMKNLIRNASEATEMELSSNEYGITESSLDSSVRKKEGGQLRLNEATEAFLAGNGKKVNLQDKHDEDNVTINLHLLPNQLLRKAEKVSGPVQPGNYWYDFRAGFWGVIGGPCLGIIPPSIEEFKYQMPENCAGGNTSVYVNGRELHQKDLNLLVSRGLPDEKNRYYNMNISGKILDEMTGERLAGLGNLAPTVSRGRRGFGMKPPRQQHGS